MYFILLLLSLGHGVLLYDGIDMPSLGFGTWNVPPSQAENSVFTALEAGYRHFDCAAKYQNEKQVGKALSRYRKSYGLSREDLWITSKFPTNLEHPEEVMPQLEETLKDLQVEYLDLYLIHWPFVRTEDGPKEYNPERIARIWEQFEIAQDRGYTRYIGVSNFTPKKLQKLIQSARHQVAVNQVELHPFLSQRRLRTFCERHKIAITAYSPLGSPGRPNSIDGEEKLLEHQLVTGIAEEHSCSPAQVLIQWSLKNGLSCIPKSINPKRIAQNFLSTSCELSAHNIFKLNRLNKNHRYLTGEHYVVEGKTVDHIWDLMGWDDDDEKEL